MRTFCLITLLLLAAPAAAAAQEATEVPELHTIRKVTLSPSYSCRSKEDFQKGYQKTALFLPGAATGRNSPALLFNGACGGADYFDVNHAGADMSVIADLGEGVELERLTAQDVFHGLRLPGSDGPQAMQFQIKAPVKWGHTYAVVINKGDFRGLLYFTVTGYIPNERLDLRYVVKHYEQLRIAAQSPGFDWTKRNSQR
jgi:hypothetical protein